MRNSLPHPVRTLNIGSRPLGQKLTIHFSINKKVICEAACQLIPDIRFIEIPIPVIHQMTRGTMK